MHSRSTSRRNSACSDKTCITRTETTLAALAQAIELLKPGGILTLAALVTLEAGKITSEGLGEVQEMIDICDFAVGLSRQLYGLTITTERAEHRMMEALGETLWEAQRNGRAPDERAYLERLQRLSSTTH